MASTNALKIITETFTINLFNQSLFYLVNKASFTKQSINNLKTFFY